MRARAWIVTLVVGCGAAGSGGETEPGTDTTGSSSADAGTGSSTGGPPGGTSDDDTTTTASEPDTTGIVDDGTTGAVSCSVPYLWDPTTAKDVLVVVAIAPEQLAGFDVDALHAAAEDAASEDGVHVAVAAPPTGNEAPAGDGYEPIALPAGADPMDVAAAVEPAAGLRRGHTPLRLVVVTDLDTSWDVAMLDAAGPWVRFAQIDARIRVTRAARCDALPGFTALTAASWGSLSCGTGLGTDSVLADDGVLAPQPACTLAPADRAPPLDAVQAALTLFGHSALGPQAEHLGAPEACRTAPAGWVVTDPGTGALGLCGAMCREVGSWYVNDRLTADVTFDCVR